MFFVVLVVVSGCLSGSLGQITNYESTPLPLPSTSFSCQGRPPGYYADLETGCRTYHVCDGISHFTYICPRRTLFKQQMRICDHSYLVQCEDSYAPGAEEGTSEVGRVSGLTEVLKDPVVKAEEPVKVETPTTATPTPTSTSPYRNFTQQSEPVPSTETTPESPSEKKFLKFTLKDFRSLFYIPEVDSNYISPTPGREFLLPVDRADNMKFKTREGPGETFRLCPEYCNPRFFLPGSCHPCIMIK